MLKEGFQMGKIKILNDNISAKIAAGEVIERPYSVVKELVENSIDAASVHITIEVEKGGKKLIRVLDDGEGIASEDVKLAFERHSTSKISKLDDIFKINTLGFRGEALASISSVSRVVLVTKTEQSTIGTRCEIDGGNIKNIEEAPAQRGCLIEVRDLFFNTPARYKFLNSDSRELSYIVEYISKIAIGNPRISFRLISDGKEIITTSGRGDLREVIARIYGTDMAKKAIWIENNFSSGKIKGLISTPQFSHGNRKGEIFYVNGRLIKDRSLSFCVERAYKTLLPGGRFPFCALFIEIDSSKVDVNIHPSKTQIKFQNQNEIERVVYNAALKGLQNTSLIPEERLEPNHLFRISDTKREINTVKPNINFLDVVYSGSECEKINERPNLNYEPGFYAKDTPSKSESTFIQPESEKFHIKKIVGQVFGTYILVEGSSKLYIIDQHAAHERILFDNFCNRFNEKTASQIISPYILQLTANEMILFKSFNEDIKRMGFDISLFGKDEILVRAVPYYFNKAVEPEVIKDILQDYENKEYQDLTEKEKLMASMACHTAIKAKDILTYTEMNKLIEQLKKTENPYTCPHGRPTIISMTKYEFEKKFKRVL